MNDAGQEEAFQQAPYHRLYVRSDKSMDVFFQGGQFGFSRPGRYVVTGDTLRWQSLDHMATAAFTVRGRRLVYVSGMKADGGMFIEGCEYAYLPTPPDDFTQYAASLFASFHVPKDAHEVPRQERIVGSDFVFYVNEEDLGGMYPTVGQIVRLRYRGQLIDPNGRLGLDLDSYPPVREDTLQFVFGDGSVDLGVEQAIQTMREGGHRVVSMREEVARALLSEYENVPDTAIFEFDLWLLDVE